MTTRLNSLALAATALIAVAVPLQGPNAAAAAALPVFDPTNHAQNLLQAARALEQINHQVRSLQNEAAMLDTMARHLERIDFPQLEQVKQSLQRIDGLMAKAQGVGFRVEQLDQRFRALFPGATGNALPNNQHVAKARARLDGALDGLRQSMGVQAQVVANINEDAGLLAELAGRSQDAAGSLQAQQAMSQLLALSTKQQLQLQSLLAAEFQSAGLERARRTQAEIDARAAARRFLGSGRAYTRP